MAGKAFSEKRFVVDNMLGKMAKWLRVLGFDTCCEHLQEAEQLEAYRRKGFQVVTRNRRWCGDPDVMCVSANDPMEQLREVMSRAAITPDDVHLLKRCILCNEPLEDLPHDQAFGLVPDYIFETQTRFYHCPNCRRIYWPGSHSGRMVKRLQDHLGWVF